MGMKAESKSQRLHSLEGETIHRAGKTLSQKSTANACETLPAACVPTRAVDPTRKKKSLPVQAHDKQPMFHVNLQNTCVLNELARAGCTPPSRLEGSPVSGVDVLHAYAPLLPVVMMCPLP